MELFIDDLQVWFVILWQMEIFKVFNSFSINKTIVNILFLLSFVLFLYLRPHLILSFDIEWIFTIHLNLEQFYHLELVGFPGRTVFMFKLLQ